VTNSCLELSLSREGHALSRLGSQSVVSETRAPSAPWRRATELFPTTDARDAIHEKERSIAIAAGDLPMARRKPCNDPNSLLCIHVYDCKTAKQRFVVEHHVSKTRRDVTLCMLLVKHVISNHPLRKFSTTFSATPGLKMWPRCTTVNAKPGAKKNERKENLDTKLRQRISQANFFAASHSCIRNAALVTSLATTTSPVQASFSNAY
jgi:hypothetical protein